MNELQKNKIDELQSKLPLPLDVCIDIAYRSAKGEISSPEAISNLYQIPINGVLSLLLNPIFSTLVHNIIIAVQKYKFDSVALSRLLNVIQYSENEKAIVAAAKVSADILGMNKSKEKPTVNVNMNFDSMIRNITEKTFPGM